MILILAIIIKSGLLLATEQEPDFLHYDGMKLTMPIGWGHPSPLQTYYFQNNIEYPFEANSTDNYRGHVAIWEISDDKLFLKKIKIGNSYQKPKQYNVKSKSDSRSYRSKVLADWFSGVITAEIRNSENEWEVEKTFYFHVRYGEIVSGQTLTKNDFERINNISEKDTSNEELMAKYSMAYMNYKYVSYYYRLDGDDKIIFNGKEGYLHSKSGLSPILACYSNDHLKWPYNWENFKKNGAPFCKWIIKNDSLFLTQLELHSGTGLYSIDKIDVDLIEIFPEKIQDEKVFGDWVSGIFVVHHGENDEKKMPEFSEFKARELTFMKLKNGISLEKYTVPADFDFENIPDGTDEGLKNILNELEN